LRYFMTPASAIKLVHGTFHCRALLILSSVHADLPTSAETLLVSKVQVGLPQVDAIQMTTRAVSRLGFHDDRVRFTIHLLLALRCVQRKHHYHSTRRILKCHGKAILRATVAQYVYSSSQL
jgi:hypothetical protein